MTRAQLGAIMALLLCVVLFGYAQQSGQDSDQSTPQQPSKPHEVPAPPRQPEVSPPQGQQETKPPGQEPEANPPKTEKQEIPRPQKEQQKSEEQQKPAHEQTQAKPRPSGKSAHIPDPQFKANFGRPHAFTVNRVITTTRVVPNQTQFVFAGYTFVFLDPWPADWFFTDECYIDYIDDQYFLFDVLHPGIRVALFVVG